MSRKQLSELNLLDRFLFNEAMEDPENMKTVLDIIFGQNISLKSAPHSEHEVRTVPDNRQVKRKNGGKVYAGVGRKSNRVAERI